MSNFWEPIVYGMSAVLGLAIIAVLFSSKAQTSGVISSAAGGFSTIILAAVSPVTGSTPSSVLGGTQGGGLLGNSTGNSFGL